MKVFRAATVFVVAVMIGAVALVGVPDASANTGQASIATSPASPSVGDNVTWTITVTNTSSDFLVHPDVEIDSLPAGHEVVSLSSTDREALNPGESYTVTAVTTATAEGSGTLKIKWVHEGELLDTAEATVASGPGTAVLSSGSGGAGAAGGPVASGGSAGSQGLAVTGTETANLVGLGATLIIVGGGAVVAARRRVAQ